MSFKDEVAKDINNVFLNSTEFASTVIFNDEPIVCVIDEEKFQQKQKNGIISNIDGVFQIGFTMFVSTEHMTVAPHIGEYMYIDDEDYIVVGMKHDMEMYEIDLVRQEER